jgi:hypothetical protein
MFITRINPHEIKGYLEPTFPELNIMAARERPKSAIS